LPKEPARHPQDAKGEKKIGRRRRGKESEKMLFLERKTSKKRKPRSRHVKARYGGDKPLIRKRGVACCRGKKKFQENPERRLRSAGGSSKLAPAAIGDRKFRQKRKNPRKPRGEL